MTKRTRLKSLLRKHEGVKHHAYKCTSGQWTIGVGRNIDDRSGLGLSDHEVDYMLENDIQRTEAELINAFSWFEGLTNVRQDVIIDICFNIGLPRLRKFVRAIAALDAGDYDKAALEFLDSRWSRQVGKRSERLANMLINDSYDVE
tara:strand:- start:7360 stop:7797 length:438 start_codon:yes stop_codon:yes gene_type:complete